MAYKLFASKNTGSILAELAFAAAGIPLDVRDIAWTDDGLVDTELAAANPLRQVPTMILPDGSTMTESGAIFLYANELSASSGLVPRDLAVRARFFHWFMIMNASLYPTFRYGDFPARWVPGCGEPAEKALVASMLADRCETWKRFEAACSAEGSWFLGSVFSALDLYIYAMHAWRPGAKWFEVNAPRLTAIFERVAKDARFASVIARNKS